MVHGGLRGAVSILLSFTIAASPAVSDRVASLTLFFISGIVLLMCINVVTTGPICHMLGLQFNAKQPGYLFLKEVLHKHTVLTLDATGMEEPQQAWNKEFPPPSLLNTVNFPAFEESLGHKRYHFSLSCKATFETLLNTRLISRAAWFSLVKAIETIVDYGTNSKRLIGWADVHDQTNLLMLSAKFRQYCCCNPTSLDAVKQLLKPEDDAILETSTDHQLDEKSKLLANTVEHLVYCAFGLLLAHERSRKLFSSSALNQEEVDAIVQESLQSCVAPAQFINRVFVLFPHIISRIKKRHAMGQVRKKNLTVLGIMKRKGILDDAILKQLLGEVEKIDEWVEELDFPLAKPLTIGTQGEHLVGNPNFGPFQRKTPHQPFQPPSISNLSKEASLIMQGMSGSGEALVDPATFAESEPTEADGNMLAQDAETLLSTLLPEDGVAGEEATLHQVLDQMDMILGSKVAEDPELHLSY